MLSIKEAVVKILRKENIENETVACENVYSRNESIDEMPNSFLLNFLSFFIEAYAMDRKKQDSTKVRDLLAKYCEECEYYGIVPRRYVDIRKSAMVIGFSREEKIFFLKEKHHFDTSLFQWDSREWILSLLLHFYILSIELYDCIQLEEKLRSTSRERMDMDVPKIQCLKIDERGARRNILVNRNNPTMTLGEFADKIMMINRPPGGSTSSKIAKDLHEDKKEVDEDLKRLREQDEFRDSIHNIRGNTQGKG